MNFTETEFIGVNREGTDHVRIPTRFGNIQFEDRYIRLYGSPSAFAIRPLANNQFIIIIGTAFHAAFGQNLARIPTSRELTLESLIEEIYYRLFGRFILIYSTPNGTYVFPDAGATRFLIYNTEHKFFTSSVHLARELLPRGDDDETSIDETYIRNTVGHYNVFGFTGFQYCRCLLPNHFLRATSFSEHRFLPVQRGSAFDTTLGERLWETLDNELRFATECILSLDKPILIPITSGRDSRTILSYFYNSGSNDVETYTNFRENTKDREYGEILARSCGYKWADTRPNGACICLPGFGGEIFKGYWSRRLSPTISDRKTRILKSTTLYDHVTSKQIRSYAEDHVSILMSLGLSDKQISEILYIEFNWGCTMGEVHNNYDQLFGESYSMFASHGVIMVARCISDTDRKRMNYWRHLCKRRAPHLCILPAGIPHFDRRHLPMAFFRLVFGWLHPKRYRQLIYSKVYFETLFYSIRFWLFRNQ